jgi:hypothetical protein
MKENEQAEAGRVVRRAIIVFMRPDLCWSFCSDE